METTTLVVGNFEHVVHTTSAGLKIDTLRPVHAQPEYEYRPATVTDKDGKELWRYQKGRYPDAFSILRDVEDIGYVLGYIDRRHLFEVIVVGDFPKMRLVRDPVGHDVYEGGRSAQALIELKELIAQDLGVQPVFTKSEAAIVQILRKRQAEARRQAEAQERAAAVAAQKERERQYQARIAAILARPVIYGYTDEGQRLSGIPVVGDEYLLVPSGKWVIAVKSYDDKSKRAGEMVEHFEVQKSGGGKVQKGHARPVMEEDPSAPRPTAVKQGELIFEFESTFEVISLYTHEGIRALYAAGLNGGTKIGLFPRNPDGSVTVYTVTKKGVREIGRFSPIVV